jgi:hypothetical protein
MSARQLYFESLLFDAQAALRERDLPDDDPQLLSGMIISDAINGLRKAFIHGDSTEGPFTALKRR